MVTDEAGNALVGIEDCLPKKSPARSRPLDAIHVDDVWDFLDALQRVEDSGVVAERQTQVSRLRCMTNRKQVELRCSHPTSDVNRDQHPLQSVPCIFLKRPDTVYLAINYNAPATGGQK